MELRDTNGLFYMAHKLVDLYPDEAISWYAVGCYYDLINKTEQGRRYLTKAASLDRLFGLPGSLMVTLLPRRRSTIKQWLPTSRRLSS